MIPDSRKNDIFACIATVIRDKGSHCYRIGGTTDHIHIACKLPRTLTQSDLIRLIKSESSRWVRDSFDPEFGWQNGFACFSVSSSHLQKLFGYIDKQVEHHRKTTFQEEFLEFLKRYNVEYDERYVWE